MLLVAAGMFLLMLPSALGHGYLSVPRPRSLVSYQLGEGLTYW